MKIAFFELEDWQREEVEEQLESHELEFYEEPLSEDNVEKVEDADVIAVFIYSDLNSKVLEEFDDLKLVTTMSTGFDHIDLNHCREKDITVCNVPTYGENTVAEHTFALILALSRKLFPSIKRTREQHSFETDAEIRGFDLKGRTIGIIGCGNIGKHTARIASGLEMDIKVFDIDKDPELAEEIGFEYVEMEELFGESDIITLHVPHNEHTHHLIDGDAIDRMKDGVIIINTARGGLIDTRALFKGLNNGKIGAAGLDVLEEEANINEEAAVLSDKFHEDHDLSTLLQDHMMMRMENVIITPHNAFNSNEALMRILNTTLENIKEFDNGNTTNTV